MANRRMFSLNIVDTDAFLEMSASAQALYFHLGMRADDDGFVSSPKRITALVSCTADDFRLLVSKGFIIPFESGICVVRDWKVNNSIRGDRYNETIHTEEKAMLLLSESGKYILANGLNAGTITNGIPDDIQMSYQRYPQVRLGKVSLGKDNKEHLCKSAEANYARVQLFEKFWKAYPKKKSKGHCEKWFTSHKPNEELVKTMITAIEKQKMTEDWTKDDGRYIPLPHTWLNGKRWEDETTAPSNHGKQSRFKEVQL